MKVVHLRNNALNPYFWGPMCSQHNEKRPKDQNIELTCRIDQVTCEKCLRGEKIGDRKKNRQARLSGEVQTDETRKRKESADPKRSYQTTHSNYAPAYSIGSR